MEGALDSPSLNLVVHSPRVAAGYRMCLPVPRVITVHRERLLGPAPQEIDSATGR